MLIINSLFLKNFMCCSKADLTFPENGLVILQGENGQGKSAALEAIAVCLAEHKRADTFKEFVKVGEKEAQIILKCTYNDEAILFDVKIGARGGTTKDVLYKERHYLNSEVTALLEDLELSFYADIILSMQDSNDITSMTPTQRADLLQKLFQFDFNKELASLNEHIEELSSFISKSTNDIDLYENIIDTKKKLYEKQKEYNITEKQYNDYKEKINSINFANITETYAKYNALFAELKSLNVDFINSKNKYNKLLESQKTLESYKKELIETQNKIDSLKEDSSFFEKENILNELLESHKSSISILHEDLLSKTESLNSLKISLKEIDNHLDLARKGKCPVCGQDTTFFNTKDLELEKQQVESNLTLFENEILKVSQSIKEKEKEMADIQTKMSQLNKCKVEQSISLKYAESQKLKIEQSINSINLDGIDELQKELQETKDTIDLKEKNLAIMQEVIDSFSSQKKEIELYEKQIFEYDAIKQHNDLIDQKNSQLDRDIMDFSCKVSGISVQRTKFVQQLDHYKEAKRVLDIELPNYLIIKTCAKLEDVMNSFIQVVFPEIRISLKRSKRGVEFFYSKGSTMLSAKMASGFEKAVLSIAFKVALCQAYNLSFAALDEIDSAASKDNSEKLFNSLISESVFKQLIIITHKPSVCDTIKDLSDNCFIYKVENGKFTSEL